ncbi:MAG TPA: tRNA (adenine-N1)-methyltransferase [Thermoplasmata archaeon]|nr:tRNA (adenine-N1)-methyltransferase [Thermoplasmata archaeon]
MDSYLILIDSRGRKHPVSLDGRMATVPGFGTFDVARLRDSVGHALRVGGRTVIVLEPSLRDLRETLARGAQSLTPKDIASIRFELDLSAGSRVVEAGTGSGALTMALARAVRPSGKVYSYDLREDQQEIARENVHRAGLGAWVDFKVGDVRAPIDETEVDALVLDIPDPWSAIPGAWATLRACGHLASFSPNMEQVKETVAELRRHAFLDVRTVELIEREMEVRDVGVRPSFAALGHTGYLTFARKVLDTF